MFLENRRTFLKGAAFTVAGAAIAKNVISTDISKDGMLEGPSYQLYKKILDKLTDLNLIASGGIASISDLEKLRELGCEGAIIGKAIYKKRIKLNQLEKIFN